MDAKHSIAEATSEEHTSRRRHQQKPTKPKQRQLELVPTEPSYEIGDYPLPKAADSRSTYSIPDDS